MGLGKIKIKSDYIRSTLRSDAVAVDNDGHIHILSVAGPETSIKSLIAALQTESKVQFELSYEKHINNHPKRHSGGYMVRRTRLDGNTWHALCLAKEPALICSLSETSLWQRLHSTEYTTPILRSWVPWLMEQLLERRGLVKLKQVGCNAALLRADNYVLDRMVSKGLQLKNIAVGE